MSSPSLSGSPGTFKVDCNVAGAFLENRPKFKFLPDFFFFFHLSSISTIIFLTSTPLKLAFTSFLCAWVRTTKVVSKRSNNREQMEDKIQLQASHGLWFDAILIYAHVVSMNIINITTECNLLILEKRMETSK